MKIYFLAAKRGNEFVVLHRDGTTIDSGFQTQQEAEQWARFHNDYVQVREWEQVFSPLWKRLSRGLTSTARQIMLTRGSLNCPYGKKSER